MKRPYGIYLVAIWFFFGFGIFILSRFNPETSSRLIDNKDISTAISVAGLLVLIYVIVGLIQVKLQQRIIAIIINTILTIYYFLDIISLLLVNHSIDGIFPLFNLSITPYLCMDVLIVGFSLTCNIYLLKSNFRQYAEKYLEFKKQEYMQKYSLKKTMEQSGK